MSYYNTSLGETRESTANGFNIYRGSLRATWRISAGSVVLEDADHFETDYSPATVHAEIANYTTCDWKAATDVSQKVIYCRWTSLGAEYLHVVPDYLIGWRFEPRPIVPVSYWVAVTAAMGWANTVEKLAIGGLENPELAYLKYAPPYEMYRTYSTLQQHWGLYVTLAVQPVLLLFALVGRWFLRDVPLSHNFGLVALLSGVQRDSLSVLGDASYSGEVVGTVVVQMVESENGSHRTRVDDPRHRTIEYVLSRGGSVKKGGWKKKNWGDHYVDNDAK